MRIVTAEEMYKIDQYAIQCGGITGEMLMENAGRSITKEVIKNLKKEDKVAVLVGGGNNGGDGFVIARTLLNLAYDVALFQLVPNKKITNEALYHKNLFENYGGKVQVVETASELEKFIQKADVLVDAILGIGVKGAIREPVRSMIEVVNNHNAFVIAVDLPSGLPADEGFKLDVAIEANSTYIIEACKQSVFMESCAPYYGEWEVVEIGIPVKAYEAFPKSCVWDAEDLKATFPKRNTFAHKGSQGKAVIIGGQLTMPGSMALTAGASLKAGAGLVTVATIPEIIPIVASKVTEATYFSLKSDAGILVESDLPDMNGFDAIALGMGMGRNSKSEALSYKVLHEKAPIVVDADGLYHLKQFLGVLKERTSETVLTPHPGEMAMLLDCEIKDVKKSPFALSKKFATEYGVYLVLKGKYTVITSPCGEQTVSMTGNAC